MSGPLWTLSLFLRQRVSQAPPPQLLAQLPGVTCTGRTPSRGPHAASSSHILVVSGRGRGRDRPLAPNGQLGVPWGRRPGLGLPSSS